MTAPGFTEDWFPVESREALAEMVRICAELDGDIVEIGAWEGRSTVAMANAAWPKMVQTIDTWQGSGDEISEQLAAERDVFDQWDANIHAFTKGNVQSHRMSWRDYSFERPIALCFIDAEHSYTEVFDNVRAVVPHLLPGAILCGDDAHHGPVLTALFDTLGADNVYNVATMWVWQMPTHPADRDEALLRIHRRGFAPTDEEWRTAVEGVMPMWERYVRTVSSLDHAASPQTVAYLASLCDAIGPKRILDLGSGLSSAVFRRWADGRDCEVATVDNDGGWLDKTRQFLDAEHLSTVGLNHRPDFPEDHHPDREYDLIFVDYANGETREAVARHAADRLADGGAIVFDDAQAHGHAYLKICADAGLTMYSLKKRTFDAIQRWAVIGVRNGQVQPPAETLAEMYAERCVHPSDIHEHLPSFVNMVEAAHAQHVIELGSRSGVSTVAWLYGLERTGGRLTSVDIDPGPQIGEWPHWTFIQGDDMDPAVFDRVDDCDILFIDTSHHFRHTLAELRLWSGKVRPGGLIVLHDTELAIPEHLPDDEPWFPVKRACERFVGERGWVAVYQPHCWGLGIIKAGEARA